MQPKMIIFPLSWLTKQPRMKSVFGLYTSSSPSFISTPSSSLSSDETYKENVLEKQADLIRYLRERNEHLSRLVLQYRQQYDFQRSIANHNLPAEHARVCQCADKK